VVGDLPSPRCGGRPGYAGHERATYEKDAAGEAIATWAVAFADVRARIQPVDQTADVEQDADATIDRYRIILAQDLAVDTVGADYRVVDVDGTAYRVERYEQAARIDVLPALVVRYIAVYVAGSSSSSSSSSGA
jgi:hypothetical protein